MKSKRTNIAEVLDLNNGSGNLAVAVDGRILFVTKSKAAARCVAADYNNRHSTVDAGHSVIRAVNVLR